MDNWAWGKEKTVLSFEFRVSNFHFPSFEIRLSNFHFRSRILDSRSVLRAWSAVLGPNNKITKGQMTGDKSQSLIVAFRQCGAGGLEAPPQEVGLFSSHFSFNLMNTRRIPATI